mgnify:CR=1 FL=1
MKAASYVLGTRAQEVQAWSLRPTLCRPRVKRTEAAASTGGEVRVLEILCRAPDGRSRLDARRVRRLADRLGQAVSCLRVGPR